MPNSPAFSAQKSSNRMSPPKMHRTLSGGASGGNNSATGTPLSSSGNTPAPLGGKQQSVEDILNASSIPHPGQPHGADRILPMPTSSASYTSSVPSASFSLSQPTSAHASPATSRASSPTASNFYGGHGHGGLAHSLHRAFGMTPANAQATMQQQQQAHHQAHHQQAVQAAPQMSQQQQQMPNMTPPHRLAPMSGPDRKGSLPSFSRGASPAFGMEVDGTA